MNPLNSKKPQTFHVLIAAAGSGARFDVDHPKQYTKIAGKALLRHTIEAFLPVPGLASLRVVIHKDHADLYEKAVTGLNLPEPLIGAQERHLSIAAALANIYDINDDEIILIHDAARPLVTQDEILKLLKAFETHDAASLAIPVSETLRKGDSKNFARKILDRKNMWVMQTPQAFRFALLKKAHEKYDKKTLATDDTSLVSHLGIPVKIVEGLRSNIKITYPDDLKMVEKFMKATYETRTGMGFDVHAFARPEDNHPLILCGIQIAHDKGLAGHSDADVGLHAVTDALLGAVSAGDIGQHFPPSDMAFKNMDSAVFLQKAHEIVKQKNGIIQNIDVTIICETPKIGPHSKQMQMRIAEILSIDPERVNIKATTTEKLGFTGRGEGIAAQAIATVEVKL